MNTNVMYEAVRDERAWLAVVAARAKMRERGVEIRPSDVDYAVEVMREADEEMVTPQFACVALAEAIDGPFSLSYWRVK